MAGEGAGGFISILYRLWFRAHIYIMESPRQPTPPLKQTTAPVSPRRCSTTTAGTTAAGDAASSVTAVVSGYVSPATRKNAVMALETVRAAAQAVPHAAPYCQHAFGEMAALVRSARNIFVLTGAGLSTESGLPDYRSPGKGLYFKVAAVDDGVAVRVCFDVVTRSLKWRCGIILLHMVPLSKLLPCAISYHYNTKGGSVSHAWLEALIVPCRV